MIHGKILLTLLCVAGLSGGLHAEMFELNNITADDVEQEFGSAKMNRSLDGNPLRIGGVNYKTGIGTHANGSIRLQLFKKAKRISGAAGVDDEVGKKGSVKFRIIDTATQKVLWESVTLKGGDPAVKFDVNLQNMDGIMLQCHDANDGNTFDHADWADVKIEYDGQAPAVSTAKINIQTQHLKWSFLAKEGSPLMQSGILPRDQKSDLRLPALNTFPARSEKAFIQPFNLTIKQHDQLKNLELVFKDMETVTPSDGLTQNIYHLIDPVYPVAVDLIITAANDCDVFTSQIKVVNNGKEYIELSQRDAANVVFNAKTPFVSHFSGSWNNELNTFHEYELPVGTFENFNSGITRTAVPKSPGVFLSLDGKAKEESGEVFAAAIAWSGSWHYDFTRTPDGKVIFSGGAYPETIRVEGGKSYTSPEVIMTYSAQGKGQASRNFHKFARRYWIKNAQKQRPIVLNSWEGVYFTFDEAKIVSMMDGAKSLGVEMFVLDDGWFANKYPRDNDKAGLGDWQVNTKKLPSGIGHLIDEAEKRGLKFGIWVEPEMVNPKSECYEKHPEWVLNHSGRDMVPMRNQYMLDLSRPEVEDFVYNSVANLLKENSRIAYIKWDHNAFAVNGGAPRLKEDQGALSERYNDAYYRIMAKLRQNFPNVIFQVCAGGGSRVDFGAMKYHEEFWASDQTNGLARIPIQWGYSHFYPSNAIGSHIGRYGDGDFKLRADICMTARLGVELSPAAINDQDREIVKKGIAAYKELRPLLHTADLYRGRSPHESDVTELTFINADKTDAVFFVIKRGKAEEKVKVVCAGLDPEKEYVLSEVNPDVTPRFTPVTMTGKSLMTEGVPFTFPAKPSSAVVRLKAK